MLKNGLFLSFEGLDGAGTTSQAEALYKALRERNLPAMLTEEPYNKLFRNEIFRTENETTRLMLFMADRALHVDNVIAPLLESGNTVICTRFVDSTMAYQGYGAEIDNTMIDVLNRWVTGNGRWLPDMTFLLDAPLQVLAERVKARGELIDYDDAPLAFRHRVRGGYLSEAALTDRIRVIDANREPDVIAAEILGIVLARLEVK